MDFYLIFLIVSCFFPYPQNQPENSSSALVQKASPLMASLDTNGDGTLDGEEIANARTDLLKLDADKDGKLSRAEMRSTAEKITSDDKKRTATLLSVLDTNVDGELDANEIAGSTSSLYNLDKNGNGKLSPNELKAAGNSDSEGREPGRGGSEDHVPKPGENKPH